jgi:hypothetical protein
MERAQKVSKGAVGEVEVEANATIVAAAVDEVLIGEGDGQARVKLYDLKESLGFDADAKVDASRTDPEVVHRDGDVMSLAQAVVEHSGYKQASVDEALAGE